MSRQHPSQQDHGPFYASDATLSFTTNLEEPLIEDLESFSDDAARWATDNAEWSGWARSVRAAIEGIDESRDEGEIPQ